MPCAFPRATENCDGGAWISLLRPFALRQEFGFWSIFAPRAGSSMEPVRIGEASMYIAQHHTLPVCCLPRKLRYTPRRYNRLLHLSSSLRNRPQLSVGGPRQICIRTPPPPLTTNPSSLLKHTSLSSSSTHPLSRTQPLTQISSFPCPFTWPRCPTIATTTASTPAAGSPRGWTTSKRRSNNTARD
jgi:hypothetical protein